MHKILAAEIPVADNPSAHNKKSEVQALTSLRMPLERRANPERDVLAVRHHQRPGGLDRELQDVRQPHNQNPLLDDL